MNKDLSPYKWKVVENIDNYKLGSVIVKAEYGLLCTVETYVSSEIVW